jgi:AcrR family transcriptional regulator
MRVKTETRRNTIIEAATHVFLEKGFEKTTMSDIATRLGGSKATLYGYFSTKEDLFLEAMNALGETLFAETYAELSTEGDIRDRLRHFGISMLSFTTSANALAMFRLIITGSARPEIGRSMNVQGMLKGEVAIKVLLKAAMDAGQLRQCDPRVVADHLRALLESEFHHKQLLGIVDIPSQEKIAAAVDRALDVFLAAYGK